MAGSWAAVLATMRRAHGEDAACRWLHHVLPRRLHAKIPSALAGLATATGTAAGATADASHGSACEDLLQGAAVEGRRALQADLLLAAAAAAPKPLGPADAAALRRVAVVVFRWAEDEVAACTILLTHTPNNGGPDVQLRCPWRRAIWWWCQSESTHSQAVAVYDAGCEATPCGCCPGHRWCVHAWPAGATGCPGRAAAAVRCWRAHTVCHQWRWRRGG